MNALLHKEIRMLLPAWAVAMVLVLGTFCFSPVSSLPVWTIASLAIGTVFLALLPFGQECNLGTFSNLLAQPVPRQRLWQVKTVVLAIALLSVLIVFLAGIGLRSPRVSGQPSGWVLALSGGVIAMAAYAGGLWTTLLFRQIAAAFWFTLLTPLVLLVITASIWGRLREPADTILIVALLVVYSIVGLWWARHQFLRAQDIQWTGGTITLPRIGWIGMTGRPPVHRPGPTRALLRKELQLHQSAYLVAGLLLLIHVMVLFVRALSHDPRDRGEFIGMVVDLWWVLWLALPLMIGASSAAEERRLGTQQSQLCLPVRRRMQTAVKFGVALVLGVCLGGLMPALLEGVGAQLGAANHILDSNQTDPGFWRLLWPVCLISAWIVVVSSYASALARHTLQAMGAAVPIGVALTALAIWAGSLEQEALRGVNPVPLIAWIGVPMLLAALLVLGFQGASWLHVGWNLWLRNAVALALVFPFIVVTAAAVHDRAWERLVRLEPRAGPALLTGPVRPQIHTYHDNIIVLLPDGRLWTPARYEDKVAYHYDNGPTLTPWVLQVPRSGSFIGASNWVALAGTHIGIVALQADGTLWWISAQTGLQQIGTESDWQSVVAGAGFFLALKTDGTLWGWGSNRSGQMGPGPRQMIEHPIQIGTEDEWAEVFASALTSTGVKRDGSVWRWGHLGGVDPGGRPDWKTSSEPVRLPWDASDWQNMIIGSSWPWLDVMLREDGTLWVAGSLPRRMLGYSTTVDFAVDPIRLGRHGDWSELQSGNSIVAIRARRLIFQSDPHRPNAPWLRRVWNPSRRSNWITITPVGNAAFVALAADGTLSMWGYPYDQPAGIAGLLAPSRKPWWTVNVLQHESTPMNDRSN